jgi:cell division protein FtsX
MTDRIHALTVFLNRPIRDDDAEAIIAAIRMIKGVADVRPHVHNVDTLYAEQHARQDLEKKLWAVLHAPDDAP